MKNCQIISVSITKEQAEFLDNNNFSSSELIQQKINEQMRLFESFKGEKADLLEKIGALQRYMQKMSEYLNEIEKYDEFLKWKNERGENS